MITEQLNDIAEFGGILLDVEQKFNGLDFTGPLTEFQGELAKGEQEAFSGAREPGGTPWAPLKPSTVKRKGHNRILFETGALESSLVAVGGPGNINAVSDHGSIFGTDVEYSMFHEEGTSRMAARPHVGTNEEAVDGLVEAIADFAVESLKFKIG